MFFFLRAPRGWGWSCYVLRHNNDLIAEAVGAFPVVGEDRVANALNLAPVLGLSWGGKDNKLWDLFEASAPKVKGMRELKNLDCSISPVKGQQRRGWLGSKKAFSFPPEVHKGSPAVH